ncbi:MAG: S8 family serine peptidase, partial [Bacteroidota bacterium]
VGNVSSRDLDVSSSSRGPATDGRIKPDLAATGKSHNSTGNAFSYDIFDGTSAAAPGIAGVAAQLYQAYRSVNNDTDPPSALIKAAMLNTTDDLGLKGPDFTYGWGRIHAKRAFDVLENQTWFSASASQGVQNQHSINIPPNVREARVMIYWNDPPAFPGAAKHLINDLDAKMTAPNAVDYLPLVPDPSPNLAALNSPAVPGIDTLNNVEQIVLTDPATGAYTLSVRGSAVPQGPQEYFVVYTFFYDEISIVYPRGGEGVRSGEFARFHWDGLRGFFTDNFRIELSPDNGNSWDILNSSLSPSRYFYEWNIPDDLHTDQALIRVSRLNSNVSAQSVAPFSIMQRPSNLTIDTVCQDFTYISWDSVPGAVAYEVGIMGEKYIDSLTTVSDVFAYLPMDHLSLEFFSVQPIGPNGGKGPRSTTSFRLPALKKCQPAYDVSLLEIVAPDSVAFSNCVNNQILVRLRMQNEGENLISDFPLSYQFNQGPIITQNFTGNLDSDSQSSFVFQTALLPATNGVQNLRVWTDLANDEVRSNDTLSLQFTYLQQNAVILPYLEDFEGFFNCGTEVNCGGENCSLANDWINLTNGLTDDIDWRVHNGRTPSLNTGPTNDHQPGNDQGKYLYLESDGCVGQEAIVLLPCVDFSNASSPQMDFWYHMYGSGIGELKVEAWINGFWIQISSLSGDQGDQWRQQAVNLNTLAGKLTAIRFRGNSGLGAEGDIAIDDIAIYDRAESPVADFEADQQLVCPGTVVGLTDLSDNFPNTWTWSIQPTTFSFQNGTDQNSQHPDVSFDLNGFYSITLQATNDNGDDVVSKTALIEVNEGVIPDLAENFEGTVFPPEKWQRVNPDGGLSWEKIMVVGSNGNLTEAALM